MSSNNWPRTPSPPMEGKGESDVRHIDGVREHSADEIAIRVQNLSKCYQIYNAPRDRLKQSIVPHLRRLVGKRGKNYFREFWALKDISLEVKKGETVGIVGRNGSGKSTLLQIICGTLAPTSGVVETNGRVAALLELGSGFNPEFTGRENVYMNGAVLGLSKEEIGARYDDIVAFADIGDFIDQPIKTYSSGMQVRLAFSVAVCVDPDILIVDEALAVGDDAFQRKCFARIEEIQARGGTILFVSHGLQTIVQLCSRAILLEKGERLLEGRPKHVAAQYQRLLNAGTEALSRVSAEIKSDSVPLTPSRPPVTDWNIATDDVLLVVNSGFEADDPKAMTEELDAQLAPQTTVELEPRGARIHDVRIVTLGGEPVNILQLGRRYVLEYLVDFNVEATDVGFSMFIRTVQGFGLAGAQTASSRPLRIKNIMPGMVVNVQFEYSCSMLPGTYFCNCGIVGTVDSERVVLHRIIDAIMFKVAPEPDLIANGRIDIGAQPRIRILDDKSKVRFSFQRLDRLGK